MKETRGWLLFNEAGVPEEISRKKKRNYRIWTPQREKFTPGEKRAVYGAISYLVQLAKIYHFINPREHT